MSGGVDLLVNMQARGMRRVHQRKTATILFPATPERKREREEKKDKQHKR
jgi:hypothetical protein